MLWPLLIAAAFLSGSIPFGLMIGLLRGVDIREHGSRNIGATNVMRVLGRRPGLACFFLDVGKGLVPTLGAGLATGLAGRWSIDAGPMALWLLVAAASMMGHIYSPWVRLKGGKGVATGLGAMLGIWPLVTGPAIAAFVVWLALLKLTRYVSIASCGAAASLPILAAAAIAIARARADAPVGWGGAGVLVGALALLAALVIWKHRSNIARIRAGAEPRTGADVGTPKPSAGSPATPAPSPGSRPGPEG
jgi:glycerol-3-phosphate acyltransferase PlsY